MGAVTPHGDDLETTWSNLKAGKSAAGYPTHYDPEDSRQFPPVNCEVNSDLDEHPNVDSNQMGRFAKMAVIATDEALTQAGLDPESDEWEAERTGASVASCFGGLPHIAEGLLDIKERGRVSPYVHTKGIPNLAAGFVTIQYDARGPSRAPSTACAASAQAISDAMDDIRTGRADVMIAGGAEAPQSEYATVVAGFGALRALTQYDGPPEKASRPFDVDRSGFVMSEGSGILILESREHAEERGADIYAELSGAGIASDATHPTGPREDAAGLTQAMRSSITDAGVDPSDIDHANLHATSTPDGDKHESLALNKVFDDPPPVTGNKSMLGHTSAACGAIETAIATHTITENFVPPTINVDEQDPECDVTVVTEPTEMSVERVLTNNAGFGGINVSLIVEAP